MKENYLTEIAKMQSKAMKNKKDAKRKVEPPEDAEKTHSKKNTGKDTKANGKGTKSKESKSLDKNSEPEASTSNPNCGKKKRKSSVVKY